MPTLRVVVVSLCVFVGMSLRAATPEIPVSFDEHLSVELVAQEPEINTPTGVVVDARGRIFVIENNTHFTPKGYKGFATDRIQIFEDFDPAGHARKISTFADGFKNSMNLVLDDNGGVIFATRNEIFFLKDTDGSGKATERKSLVTLETKGNYPHNGLAGLALSADGGLYFGLGENLGEPYVLKGSDGSSISGGGEGGSIFRVERDGSKLTQFATGFWNPWGLKFDATGRLFAVDNDPDSRPPCRLLHVVPGGDYGYRFKYGRKGTHPFDSWNGEIPGTLPMLAGTGEAPCAIYDCDAKFWPKEYVGDLLVTAWGDHVIQRFHLNPVGASFQAQPEVVIKGGVDFRPVGLVPAPDGSLIVTDWVSSSYPVHGKGRIWRLKVKAAPAGTSTANTEPKIQAVRLKKTSDQGELLSAALNDPNPELRVEALARLNDKASSAALMPMLANTDPFVFAAAINALGRLGNVALLTKAVETTDARKRLGVLLALRKLGDPKGRDALPKLLLDDDTAVRRAALQWAGEERITAVMPQVNQCAKLPMTRDLFDAYLAAKSLLSGDKPDKGEYIESQMAQIFPSDKNPLQLRVLALKFLRVDHPGMTVAKLKDVLASSEPALRAEALRALSVHGSPDAQPLLRTAVADATLSLNLRAAAAAGLARSTTSEETRAVLLSLLKIETPPALQREALRALRAATTEPGVQDALLKFATVIPSLPESERGELAAQLLFLAKFGKFDQTPEVQALAPLQPVRPANEKEWTEWALRTDKPASPSAGERLFYSPRGPQCVQCHRINGRGGQIGPDLTTIGKTVVGGKIAESILEPSRDVAPQFVQWALVMKDGRKLTGVIVEENNAQIILGDSSGAITKFKNTEVERRVVLKGSLMPDKLIDTMTPQEFRDILAFLSNPDWKE